MAMLLVKHDPMDCLADGEEHFTDDLLRFDAAAEAQKLLERIERGERQSVSDLMRCTESVPEVSQSSFVIENARDYQRQVSASRREGEPIMRVCLLPQTFFFFSFSFPQKRFSTLLFHGTPSACSGQGSGRLSLQ